MAEIDGVELTNEVLNPEADPNELEQQTSTDPIPQVETTEAPKVETTEPTQGTEDEGVETAATGTPSGEGVDDEPELDPVLAKRMQKLEEKLEKRIGFAVRKALKQGKISVPEPIDQSKAPKLDDFETIEEFEKAQEQWAIETKVNEQIRKVAQSADDTTQGRREFIDDMVSEGQEIFTDFDEVALAKTVPITDAMIDWVRDSENDTISPAEFFYYFGKNLTETTALSRIKNPSQFARKMIEIEGNITAAKAAAPKSKPKKTVTSAEEPIRPNESSVVITKDPNRMSQAEYEKWRSEGGGR